MTSPDAPAPITATLSGNGDGVADNTVAEAASLLILPLLLVFLFGILEVLTFVWILMIWKECVVCKIVIITDRRIASNLIISLILLIVQLVNEMGAVRYHYTT